MSVLLGSFAAAAYNSSSQDKSGSSGGGKMRATLLLSAGVLVVCATLAAQAPAPDASKVFAYDETKPLNLTTGKSETPTNGVTVF